MFVKKPMFIFEVLRKVHSMGNFRAYPGRWVRVTRDIGELKKDEIVQMLSAGSGFGQLRILTFVGKKGSYPADGTYLEPIEDKHHD